MIKRLIAMLAVCALLCGGIFAYYARTGSRTDSIYYAATGIRPDAPLLSVNGESVSAEEYFYWLDSVCEYLDSYVGGGLDFNTQVTETMTFAQFAKSDAANTVVLYAVVRQMARENGISLTDEDVAALAQQRQEYVAYYGSEEAYAQQLQFLGVPEEQLQRINEVPYLYNRMYQEYSAPTGKLYPGAEVLQAYGEENGYVTAQLLYFPTEELDESAIAGMKEIAQAYAELLSTAEDKQATYETLAAALELTTDAAGYTFCPADSDAAVCAAVAELAVGEVSGVIEGDSGFYVALRMETNYAALTEVLFNIYLQESQDSAKVEYTSKYYDALDAGAFYEAVCRERDAMVEALSVRSR